MTDTLSSQSTDLSSWDILCIKYNVCYKNIYINVNL
jgi:hypothetical protein